MNEVVYWFGSGLAFWPGVALLLLAMLVTLSGSERLARRRPALVLIGGLAVILSATPLSNLTWAGLGVLTLAWLRLEDSPTFLGRWGQPILRALVTGAWISVAMAEYPHTQIPTLPRAPARTLYLIGDSLSVVLSEQSVTPWPAVIATEPGVTVRNLAVAGHRTGDALKPADKIDGPGLVLLEIGGNDLLYHHNAQIFADSLEKLLQKVCRSDRQVVMLELPLPPFHNGFGQVQRDLARRHGVTLIPKWVLLRVITTAGSTTDGIHLNQQGHTQMATAMWEILHPALK